MMISFNDLQIYDRRHRVRALYSQLSIDYYYSLFLFHSLGILETPIQISVKIWSWTMDALVGSPVNT